MFASSLWGGFSRKEGMIGSVNAVSGVSFWRFAICTDRMTTTSCVEKAAFVIHSGQRKYDITSHTSRRAQP
jgi:hypothetical protein